ncbi:aspartate aminotransferase family protein [Limisalsivibrio acetivorans]|uniref:aspartate aminotransferase family protein n=1 Tax=Limisalsivibrio acetivorans TaxID=1304888 RepID=UPI0003B60C52|nr:aminotransferase class III-fold pyridoxal phosphate-dependent enzyme [Limisalsivibrio acetivorans]
MGLEAEYRKKFPKSAKEFERSKELFPGGICHDIRSYPPYPFVTDRADGAYIYDIDGNRITDMWMGHFANILGHASPHLKDALTEAESAGVHHGLLNRYQIEFAELLKSAVPELEMMRFTASGTEATMYACRVAKAYTGRELILKIEGGWHGGNSELSYDVKPPFKRGGGELSLSLPYNNMEITSGLLESVKDKAAAVIMEPMLGAGGGIVADREYVNMIREWCNRTGTLLIFDEVITGFRFRYGSFWPVLGVRPDLFTMGKIIAGGLNIGLYGGRKEIMQSITEKGLIVGGGTYSASPLSMIGGVATLKELRDKDYDMLNASGDIVREIMQEELDNSPAKGCVTGFGSFFCLHFTDMNRDEHICRPSRLLPSADKDMENSFKTAMLLNNIYTVHSGGALSFAHLKTDIHGTLRKGYRASLEAALEEKKGAL